MCSWTLKSLFSLNIIAACLLITTFHLEILEMIKSWKHRENAEILEAFVYEAHVWKAMRFSLLLLPFHTNLNSANQFFLLWCVLKCVYKCLLVYILKHLLYWMLNVLFYLISAFFYSFWCWDYERYPKSEWQGAVI